MNALTHSEQKRMKIEGYPLRKFYPVAFITVVIIVATCLLALTDSFTRDKLQVQQDQQTLEMLRQVFPETGFYILEEESEIYTIYDNSGNEVGYAFYAEGLGKAVYGGECGRKEPGPIVILVGLEDRETIKGIFVVSHSETPLFWNLLIMNNYFDQFVGLKIEDTHFTRDGGQVDAVTGATLSSTLVLDTVREAVLEKVKSIR